MKKCRNKSGFTLIELLVVVAILAILTAISIPMFSGYKEKARIRTDATNEQIAMRMALEDEASTNGKTGASGYWTVDGSTYYHEYIYVSDGGQGYLDPYPADKKVDTDNVKPYGQCSHHSGCMLVVKVTFDKTTNRVKSFVSWKKIESSGALSDLSAADSNLCGGK